MCVCTSESTALWRYTNLIIIIIIIKSLKTSLITLVMNSWWILHLPNLVKNVARAILTINGQIPDLLEPKPNLVHR